MESRKVFTDEVPVEGGALWPEARQLERIYVRNPMAQARFVKALIGFRALAERNSSTDTIKSIESVIRSFSKTFPEFLQERVNLDELDREFGGGMYEADPRLLSYVSEILAGEET